MNQKFEVTEEKARELLREARDLYRETLSIYNKTGYSQSYKLSHIWNAGSDNMNDLLDIIESGNNALDSIRLIQNNYMYAVNPSDNIKEKVVDWYIDYLQGRGYALLEMDDSFQESPVTDPAVCVRRAKRLLTPDFLLKVVHCLEIKKYCKTTVPKFRIIELGGGYGCFARTLKLFVPGNVHIDIDIPETLYFSYIFLRLSFPAANICYVTDPSQVKDGIDQFDFILIPTMFAECILGYEFDLFSNTASLGEMTNPVIRHWMDFVQNKLQVKYFFGVNRYLNAILPYEGLKRRRVNENECSVLFDARWKILLWELDPPFARCPFEEPTNITQYLEIIAERLPDNQVKVDDNEAKSMQIIESVADEDWIRCRDTCMNSMMRYPLRVHDFTMNGTLFKLWESIRLHPNKTNIAIMLFYLSALMKKGYPFEEWFYYRKVLSGLVAEETASRNDTISGDGKHRDIWKNALELSVSYNHLTFRECYYFFLRLIPFPIRIPVIRLIEVLHKKLLSVFRSGKRD